MEVGIDLMLLLEPVHALVVRRRDGGGALGLGGAIVVEGAARVRRQPEEAHLSRGMHV